MKLSKDKLIIWIPVFVLVVGSIIYARKSGTIEISGKTMGTTYSVKLVYTGDSPDKEFLKKRIDDLLVEFNDSMSTYIPDSEISKFNKSPSTSWAEISKDFYSVVKLSKSIHGKTRSFDPTIGPAINLWGFGEDGSWQKQPSDSDLKNTRNFIGFEKIDVNPNKNQIRKLHPKTSINLSAIAKGYAVDVVSSYLRSIKAKNFLVEIGGEIRAEGNNNSGESWQIGIESPDPAGGSLERILSLKDLSMATSGNYRNYFERDGVRYSHIISPETLRPVTHNTASVSVVHRYCGAADGWSTALLAMNPSEALSVAESNNIAALFILNKNGYFVTKPTREFEKIFKNF